MYGANSYIERQELWHSLVNLKNSSPWIVLGDFNSIRTPHEKSSSNSQWPAHMDDLNSCLYTSELDDLRYSGCFFTWSNRQAPPNHVSTKIDRVLINDSWNRSFPQSSSYFPTPGVSDHTLALVHLTPIPKRSPRPFRFSDFLAENPQFPTIVQKVWREVILGNPMFCIVEKLRILQAEFKSLNIKEYSSISKRVIETKQHLEVLQKQLGSDPYNPIIQTQERLVYKQYIILA